MNHNMVFSYCSVKQKQRTSVASRFNGHASALEQYRGHPLIRHVQGYPGSHRTLPLGDYSLRIAPAAARATANRTSMKKWTNFAGHF